MRQIAVKSVVVFVLVSGCCQSPQPAVKVGAELPDFARMNILETDEVLQQMKDRGDLDGLIALARSDIQCAGWAAADAVSLMPFPRAVAFCNSFGVGTPRWASAFYGLSNHRREDVSGYLQELITRPDPSVRFHCYRLCESMGWDDLLAYAVNDLQSRAAVGVANQLEDEQTVGDVARKYLNSLKAAQP